MNKEEIELQKSAYLLDKNLKFYVELNNLYNQLCYGIKKRKWLIRPTLSKIVLLVEENWEQVYLLSREDMYMVLNCIKLARSAGISEILNYNKKEFQKLEENYTNFR